MFRGISAPAKFVATVSILFAGLTIFVVLLQASHYEKTAREGARRNAEQLLSIIEQTIFVDPELFQPAPLTNIITRFAKVANKVQRISITDESLVIIADSDRSRLGHRSDYETAALTLRTGLRQNQDTVSPEAHVNGGRVGYFEVSHIILGPYQTNRKSNVLGVATIQVRLDLIKGIKDSDWVILVATIAVGFFFCGAMVFLALRILLNRISAEMTSARDEAVAANVAKSNFLACMSHEIRTPMNGVLGMVGALMNAKLSEEQRKQVRIIKHSGETLLSLLNDILDLTKVEAGQVELEDLNFDLSDLLDSVKALWESRFQAKTLGFSIEVASELPSVLRGDPIRIRQILFNLIGNASKFTETGGVRVVVSQQSQRSDEVEIRFDVIDSGIGIPADLQPRLFSSFTQADSSVTRKYGGTGLGLAISKQLAELMGGEIGVESVVGQGSRFWFSVRCAPGDPQAAKAELFSSEALGDKAPEWDRKLRILIAEDNHVNQAVLRAILGQTGHEIEIVDDGAKAVAAVMRSSYDLVLMDVQMPDMDGVTATRKIRDLPGDVGQIPIIALTANAMKGNREEYLAAGMTDYVSKPINSHELSLAIARACAVAPTDPGHEAAPETAAEPEAGGSGDKQNVFGELMESLESLKTKS
jgi:signal transduction histidine kinase/CheY-like chemotaxis protein